MFLLQMNFGGLEVWQWIILTVVLIPMSVKDIKTKEINGYLCLIAIMATLVFRVRFLKEQDIDIIIGMIPGVVMLIFSYFSYEQIGYGDGLLMIFVGCVVGFSDAVISLMVSLWVSGVIGLTVAVIGKSKKDKTIPFVPFMSVGVLAGGLFI